MWPLTCRPSRSAHKLEQQICACIERMQERTRNPTGTTTEQMAEAEEDVREVTPILYYSHSTFTLNSQVIDLNLFCFLHFDQQMRKLQPRLLQKKRNLGSDLEKGFYIIPGDTWQSFHDNWQILCLSLVLFYFCDFTFIHKFNCKDQSYYTCNAHNLKIKTTRLLLGMWVF